MRWHLWVCTWLSITQQSQDEINDQYLNFWLSVLIIIHLKSPQRVRHSRNQNLKCGMKDERRFTSLTVRLICGNRNRHLWSNIKDRNTASHWVEQESPWLLGLHLWPLADEGRGILAALTGWQRRRKKQFYEPEAFVPCAASSQRVFFFSGWPEGNPNKQNQFFTDSLVLTWISAASAGCTQRRFQGKPHIVQSHTRESKHVICSIYVQISTDAARQTKRLMLMAKSKTIAAILNTSPAATDSLQK